MPVFNLTIDDLSPMWMYTGVDKDNLSVSQSWHIVPTPSDVNNDTPTSHQTNLNGATAKLFAMGKAIAVYGSKGPTHGSYTANLKGDHVFPMSNMNGHSDDVQYNQQLFSTVFDLSGQSSLPQLSMTATGTDGGGNNILDIDYAVVTLGDGNPSSFTSNATLDDTNANITYPIGNWIPEASDQYHERTMHRTNDGSAQAVINFYGNTIAVYGGIDKDHGQYGVQLDGSPLIHFNGNSAEFHAQTLLVYASNFGNGPHQLILTNVQSGSWLDIDYVEVHDWDPIGFPGSRSDSLTGGPTSATTDGTMPAGTSTGASQPSPSLHHGNSTAAVAAGAVIGTLLLLTIVAGGILYFVRRQRRQRQAEHRQVAASYQREPAWNNNEKSAAAGPSYSNQTYLPRYEA